MKTRYLLATAALMGGAFLALQPAQAGTIPVVWNFMGNNVNLGTTATFTSNPTVSPAQNIVATGYNGPNSTQDLFGKNGGTGEQGLGLTNDPTHDNEITYGSFIQLDISGLTSPPLATLTLSFQAGSTTPPDKWGVFGTNTAGTLSGATQIQTGTNDNLVAALGSGASLIGTYKYLDVTELSKAPGANVLLGELDNSVSTGVPEPASLALLGVGLLGIGLVRRRKS